MIEEKGRQIIEGMEKYLMEQSEVCRVEQRSAIANIFSKKTHPNLEIVEAIGRVTRAAKQRIQVISSKSSSFNVYKAN